MKKKFTMRHNINQKKGHSGNLLIVDNENFIEYNLFYKYTNTSSVNPYKLDLLDTDNEKKITNELSKFVQDLLKNIYIDINNEDMRSDWSNKKKQVMGTKRPKKTVLTCQ